MEAVGNVAFSRKLYHLVHHVTGTCHHKAHIVVVLEHLGGGFNEIFRSFLHCDTAKECHYFFFGLGRIYVQKLFAERCHSVVYCGDFGGINAVFLNHGAACEIADGDDVVSIVHAVFFDAEHCGVHIASAAVKVGGMHMDYERLAGNLLGMDAGRVSEPVVGVYYVEIKCAGNYAGANRVVVDFSPLDRRQRKRVLDVVTRELLTPKGLRTLSPNSFGYRPFYLGSPEEREMALHNGPARPWLFGFYAEAYLRVFGLSGVSYLDRMLIGYEDEMTQACVGALSQLYDANPPFSGRGAISHATNVAGILRTITTLKKFNV
jgi:hypothetical protein